MTTSKPELLIRLNDQMLLMFENLSSLFKQLLAFLLPSPNANQVSLAGLSPILSQGQERILTALLRTIALLGSFSLLLTVPAILREGHFDFLGIYGIALSLCWFAALNRGIDYRLRAGLLLGIEYGVGMLDLLNFGLAEDGRIYLFAFSIMTLLLLGPWAGLTAVGLSLLTLGGVGWLISTHQFVQFSPAHIPTTVLTLETVIITCAVFLMQAGTIMAALQVLFRALETAWQQERQTAQLLEEKRDSLEAQVAGRIQELAQARDQALEASQAKTQLLAKVSHELRTPLGIILGYTEMVQEGFYGPISAEQQAPLKHIIESTHYLTKQVSDLLEQARLDAGKLELSSVAFILKDLIQEVEKQMEVLALAKKLAFRVEVAADMPVTLWGDPTRLQQILVNLTGNAIKFTQAGSIFLSIYRHDELHWVIQVSDTGPGIPPEAQTYIFDPFRQVDNSLTRTHEGTGLGLSIVKQLVTLMGGQISLKSEVAQGSTFTVLLPLKIIQEAE